MAMNGCILRGTPIAVDFWQLPNIGEERIYFLTHLHCDHTKGLTSSWRFPFYTSLQNHSLLRRKFQFAKGIVIPLELDEPHIIPIDAEGETLTATLVNANHVPGAVMFFFQGSFGDILYCGDMRFYPEMFEHPVLSQSLRSGGIDRLYLDNTFCHPKYNFPSRQNALQEVFRIIEQHPNHTIKLGIRRLGKEDLLEAVARKFQELILVYDEKYEQMKTLKRLDVYTKDDSQSRIHAVIINRIHVRNHKSWNEAEPTISILLTAMYCGVPPHEMPLLNTKGIFIVPYSDHSSWEELVDLVRRLRPREIIPIVKDKNKNDYISLALKGRDDMSVFDDFLISPPSTPSSPLKRSPNPPLRFETTTPNLVKQTFHAPILEDSKASKRKLKQPKKKAIPKGVLFVSVDDVLGSDSEKNPHSSTTNEMKRKASLTNTNSFDGFSQSSPLSSKEASPEPINESQIVQKESNFCQTSSSSSSSSSPSPAKTTTTVLDECSIGREKINTRHNSREEPPLLHVPPSNYFAFDADVKYDLIVKARAETESILNRLTNEPQLDVDDLLNNVGVLSESLELVNNYF